MDKVTVYKWQHYDEHDNMRISRRLATRETAEKHGAVIEGTGIEVDASAVGGEIEGMTARDFNPNPRSPGFQRIVERDMRSS